MTLAPVSVGSGATSDCRVAHAGNGNSTASGTGSSGCEMNIAFANAAQIQTQPGEMAKNRIAKAAVSHSLTVPPASALFVGAW